MRDAFLTVSDSLNTAIGGPGVKPRVRPELLVASQRNKWPIVAQEGPEHWRRSVYVYVKRQLLMPMLELFDAPASTHSCDRREDSLVPTQSLVLMNDEFVREQAARFADRVVREVGEDRDAWIARAFWVALSREPSQSRIDAADRFLDRQMALLIDEGMPPERATREAMTDFCQILMNLSEFVYLD